MATIKSMGNQCSFFDGSTPLKITKKIRLIELFAGIGSQAQALKNLGSDFEHYRICEFDKYAVASYNAVHGTNFQTSDITKLKAKDLGIEETDKFTYIMTYSFPCTDLSKAGKQQGMSKDSGTRSGLLWEVERLLKELVQEGGQLPQILLMENVPDVISDKNKKDFFSWCGFLEEIGYTSKYALLNAKDFGVPQNRERCFMLSLLGDDYYYDFPEGKPLTKKLKDVLETEVEEKYYLSDKTIKCLNLVLDDKTSFKGEIKCKHVAQLEGKFEMANMVYSTDGLCPTIRTMQGGGLEPKIVDDIYKSRDTREYENYLPTLQSERQGLKVKEPMVWDGFNQAVRADSSCVGTLTRNCGADLKRNGQGIIENKDSFRIRKLTPKECWALMGFDDESFFRAEKVVSNSKLYKQAGNSIVVDVLMAIFKNLF